MHRNDEPDSEVSFGPEDSAKLPSLEAVKAEAFDRLFRHCREEWGMPEPREGENPDDALRAFLDAAAERAANAYQTVGVLATYAGVFGCEEITKALDYFSGHGPAFPRWDPAFLAPSLDRYKQAAEDRVATLEALLRRGVESGFNAAWQDAAKRAEVDGGAFLESGLQEEASAYFRMKDEGFYVRFPDPFDDHRTVDVRCVWHEDGHDEEGLPYGHWHAKGADFLYEELGLFTGHALEERLRTFAESPQERPEETLDRLVVAAGQAPEAAPGFLGRIRSGYERLLRRGPTPEAEEKPRAV